MSADLFAAFGESEPAEQTDSNFWQTPKPAQQQNQLSQHDTTLAVEDNTWQPWPSAVPSTPQVSKQLTKVPSPLWQKDYGGNDVLFDANDDAQDHEDDFGDFEEAAGGTAESVTAISKDQSSQLSVGALSQISQPKGFGVQEQDQPSSGLDLLGFDNDVQTQQSVSSHIQSKPAYAQLDPFAAFDAPTKTEPTGNLSGTDNKTSAQASQAQRTNDDFDDEWGTFEEAEKDTDVPARSPPSFSSDYQMKQPAQSASTQVQDIWDFSSFESNLNQNAKALTSSERDEVEQEVLLESSPSRRQPPGFISRSLQHPESHVQKSKISQSNNQQQQAIQQVEGEEEWDDFESMEPSTAVPQQVATSSKTATNIPTTTPSRPTNIPPPSMLLQLFTKVFSQLAAGTNQSPSPLEHGQLVLHCYKVLARILAGRSFRWKRDTVLAQSMSISAASGGRGMKLTSLDRGESRKEDQEAELAVATWTKHAHALSTAITKAKLQKPAMSLSATGMKVRAESGTGVLNATHTCPVCGLKRNERVLGIDVKVDDTFGEFWVEHWGHKGCFDFWYAYNNILSQR